MGLLSDLYEEDLLAFLEALVVPPAILIAGLYLTPDPKINGQKPVVRLEEAMSYGFDFDKDGKIDAACCIPIGGTPRVPSYRLPLDRNCEGFRDLQYAYDKIRK